MPTLALTICEHRTESYVPRRHHRQRNKTQSFQGLGLLFDSEKRAGMPGKTAQGRVKQLSSSIAAAAKLCPNDVISKWGYCHVMFGIALDNYRGSCQV